MGCESSLSLDKDRLSLIYLILKLGVQFPWIDDFTDAYDHVTVGQQGYNQT